MAPSETVASANLYAGNPTPGRAIDALLAHEPVFVGISEGYRHLHELRGVDGYRMFFGEGAEDHRRGAKDTPVLARADAPMLLQSSVKAANRATPARIAPDRFITVSARLVLGRRVALVNQHPHAAIAGAAHRSPQPARLTEYDRQSRALLATLTWLHALGFEPWVTGDHNVQLGAHLPGLLTPYDVFRELGYEWFGQGLDSIAWQTGRWRRVDGEVIPTDLTGSDHPFVVATLAPDG